MEIVRGCLERHLRSEEENEDKDFLFWEGNYWDGTVHDCAQLSLSTVNVLVNKIGCVLVKYCGENDKVLLFLPQVLQLPLSLLAAAKVGVTAIPLDPKNCSSAKLKQILDQEKPTLAVTVDAYWQGLNLFHPYKELEAALGDTSFCTVLEIRHTSPNPGVPSPDEHILGRRPYYKIEWSIREERDVEWSEEIRRIPSDAVAPKRNSAAPFVLLASLSGDEERLKPIFSDDLLPKIENVAERISGISFSLGHPETFEGLVNLLSVWWNGEPLVQFEGDINFPDPARIAHIVKKYEVNSLLMSTEAMDPSYLRLVNTKTLKTVVGPGTARHTVNESFPGADFVSTN